MNPFKRLLCLLVLLPPMTEWAAEAVGEVPLLAIWKDSDGMLKTEAPYLRIAIWNDGRIIFAKDPKKWSHELLEGRIEPERIRELKMAIESE
jgi:hypothetical protein